MKMPVRPKLLVCILLVQGFFSSLHAMESRFSYLGQSSVATANEVQMSLGVSVFDNQDYRSQEEMAASYGATYSFSVTDRLSLGLDYAQSRNQEAFGSIHMKRIYRNLQLQGKVLIPNRDDLYISLGIGKIESSDTTQLKSYNFEKEESFSQSRSVTKDWIYSLGVGYRHLNRNLEKGWVLDFAIQYHYVPEKTYLSYWDIDLLSVGYRF